MQCGEAVFEWLIGTAESASPHPVDRYLLLEIHRRWFETTFPADAGHLRTGLVLNRKGTAVAPPTILPSLENAFDNWAWRRTHLVPDDDGAQVEFIVAEANSLVVDVYDIHPFVDGNTRTTWHLRNYVLMFDGLRPLVDLEDQERYEDAWWSSTPHEHDELDQIVLLELAAQDR